MPSSLRMTDFQQVESDLARRLSEEIGRFNKYIGKPHVLVSDPDESSIAVGYWRTPEGVMVIERSRDGQFRPMKAQFFDDEVITAIAQATRQKTILHLDFDFAEDDPGETNIPTEQDEDEDEDEDAASSALASAVQQASIATAKK